MSEDPSTYGLHEIPPRWRAIGDVHRPSGGWIREIREARDLTLANVARRMKVTPPAVRSFEKAEAEDRITLASLRRTAEAMDCELIYALVPRSGAAHPVIVSEVEARGKTHALSVPLESAAGDDASKKVTDLTWHTLHGEP